MDYHPIGFVMFLINEKQSTKWFNKKTIVILFFPFMQYKVISHIKVGLRVFVSCDHSLNHEDNNVLSGIRMNDSVNHSLIRIELYIWVTVIILWTSSLFNLLVIQLIIECIIVLLTKRSTRNERFRIVKWIRSDWLQHNHC